MEIFYPVHNFTQVVSMLAMCGQFCQFWQLCLCILTPSRLATYFGYFSDILHVVYKHSPSAPYHLTQWRKQICRFVGANWVEYAKVPFNWGCESCVWIVWLHLIIFFWCYFLALNCIFFWLNHLSTHILFYWTVPVAVHWLDCFCLTV